MIKRLQFSMSVAMLLYACEGDGVKSVAPVGTDYVTRLEEMKKVEVGHGETVYQMEGRDHGLNDLSLVITETQPGGGPDLHWHTADEVHVVLHGKVTYTIGDSVFTVTGKSVVNVPARMPHTFINAGDSVLNLVVFFSEDNYGGYHPLGPNPLLNRARQGPRPN